MSDLAVFITVAEQGSFVGAGRSLGVSASAVGKRVSRLEAELGARLLQRSTRALALTAEGETVLSRGRRMLEEAAAMRAELERAGSLPEGVLRLSLPPIGGVMMAELGAFQLRYPEVSLELDYSERNVDLIEEGFDAAIRVGAGGDGKLRSLVLPGFRRLIVAAPDYLARHGRPDAPEQLADHRLIHYRSPNSGKLEDWPLADAELPRALVCNSVHARLEFALQGHGIACLPDVSIRRELDDGSLRPLLSSENGELIALRLLWPSSRGLSARMAVFMDFMRQAAQERRHG
ncbi:LysR family transcriptional regulator [Chromobacterium vaccinii]|uniref:LysR family transcriptional regulator n=1 Tax=Chromobacterium vaccinii TaxID=1108595 RepID=UPI001E2F4A48|nr:LysR family transcriptional regulator [Chromobacterium vaccinii]MCD4500443.1 LysR family transcriptional regulator [Chromobacterium vaccinii]